MWHHDASLAWQNVLSKQTPSVLVWCIRLQLYVQHRLCVGRGGEVRRQSAAFRDGFKHVLNSRIVAFFQPRELMELVMGNENYDWSELRKVG